MALKHTIEKISALICITGIMAFTNIPLVYAYEAHVMNVTANIVDDSISISPSGENFCNDGKLKVELASALPGSGIYYTSDGSNPVCGKNGKSYSAPFTLSESKTIKAVACHDGLQSLTMTRNFHVADEFCDHTSIKINKVYYNVDSAHMASDCPNENEWVELYNPTKDAINIKGWKICDGKGCDTLGNYTISAKGYAVIANKENTWNYWNIPSDVVKINLGSDIGDNGLDNTGDILELKDANNDVIDGTYWGTISSSWSNYSSRVWANPYGLASQGSIFYRISNGYDTDKAADWTISPLPAVSVNYPNGGEVWTIGKTYSIKWTAANGNSAYSIDIYYSNDSGKTWANVVKNTENDGSFDWRLPLSVTGGNGSPYYITASKKARIKVVATDYARNFMFSNYDISDQDFCPPIDMSLLTPEEKEILKTVDTTGMTIIDSGSKGADLANTETPASSNSDTDSKTEKSSEMINKDNKDYILGESDEKGGDGKGTDKAATDTEKADDSQSQNDKTTQSNTSSTAESGKGTADGQSVKTDNNTESPISSDNDAAIAFNLNV